MEILNFKNIDLKQLEFDDPRKLKSSYMCNATYNDKDIIIEVKDNGIGIDEKMMGKIFEPYFTTKAKGTGLGLSIVKRIIEDHGGKIKIEKNKNMAGTTSLIIFENNA